MFQILFQITVFKSGSNPFQIMFNVFQIACPSMPRLFSNDFAITFLEFRDEARHVAEFGRANRREVFRMRKQDSPAVTDPIMKIDGAFRGLGSEVRRVRIDSQ